MPTATQTQTPDLSGLFDLDIEIELDDTTVTDCCSSILCGYSECGTSCSPTGCYCSIDCYSAQCVYTDFC